MLQYIFDVLIIIIALLLPIFTILYGWKVYNKCGDKTEVDRVNVKLKRLSKY
jgi:hypothetical protein